MRAPILGDPLDERNYTRPEFAFCRNWLEKGQELKRTPKEHHRQLRYISSRVALLRTLALRQALIKWLSPNWTMASTNIIRYRHISLMAQVKLMGEILGDEPPPKVLVVDEKAHPVKATEVLMQYDCSLWLVNRLIKNIGHITDLERSTVLRASEQLYNDLLNDLYTEWGEENVKRIEASEDTRLYNVLSPDVNVMGLMVMFAMICFYTYTFWTIVENSVELFLECQRVPSFCSYFWCLWTAIVIYGQHRRKVCYEEVARTGKLDLLCRCLAIQHILDYQRQLYVMWQIWRTEGQTIERQKMMARLYHYQQEVNRTIYARINNELLPRLVVDIQLLLRQIVHKPQPALDPTGIILGFTPFRDLHDRVFLDAFISAAGACTLYRNRFRGMHYTFLCDPFEKSLRTNVAIIQGSFSLLSLYIPMSLFIWKAPLLPALGMFIGRTIVIMYLDDSISFNRHFLTSEFSTLPASVTFFERFIFYLIHPAEIKSSYSLSMAYRLLDLSMFTCAAKQVVSEVDFPGLSRCFTVSYLLFVFSEIATYYSCDCHNEDVPLPL